MRGNQVADGERFELTGSIPARAGEPGDAQLADYPPRVYPRACGGTTDGSTLNYRRSGLSPRVRGNRGGSSLDADDPRSIPARAGEPPAVAVFRSVSWVYPRACGGTAAAPASMQTTRGLSPRVRGNRQRWRCFEACPGSIPARAGEPPAVAVFRSVSWVYPRACGGTAIDENDETRKNGLSPRVRGNPIALKLALAMGGSIPARAGEPTPRARDPPPVVRSIPARAGEPRCRPPSRRSSWVYPRACGGTVLQLLQVLHAGGLSPRVRGNPAGLSRRTGQPGSIPARAGEPP